MATTESDTDGFEAEIDTTALDEYLQALDALVDEALIEPHDGGFRTDGIDPANVAMLRATLAVDAFADAPTMGEAFGIRPLTVRDVLTDADTTGLEYDANTRKLSLRSGPYRYTHSALSPDTIREADGPPDMDLGFEAELSGDQFREVVEWFDGFTTHLRMGYDPSGRRFWIEANERRGVSIGTDDGCFELPREGVDYVRDAGHADSMFSVDYTRDIAGAIPDGRTVTIRVGEEFPMILSYPIHDADGATCGRVEFMQAPRIQPG